MLEKRTREWIMGPTFSPGPISRLRECCHQVHRMYKERHPEYDEFLNGLYRYIKKEDNPDYKDIQLYLEGIPDFNCSWIISGVCIKLYNYCLSPEQAFEYIKECHKLYLLMSNAHYTMYGEPKIFVQTNSDKEYKYIQVDMKPTKKIEEIGYYFFRMSIPNEVWIDGVNDIQSFLRDIKLINGDEKLEDALELFVRHQKRPLFKDMFNTAIKELTKNGYIKETKIKTSIIGIPIYCYDF